MENTSTSRPTTSSRFDYLTFENLTFHTLLAIKIKFVAISFSFGGAGYRLGQTEDDHIRLGSTASSSRPTSEPIILRLWRQGFTIGDNGLRLYEDPKNREFLEYITKGYIYPYRGTANS